MEKKNTKRVNSLKMKTKTKTKTIMASEKNWSVTKILNYTHYLQGKKI